MRQNFLRRWAFSLAGIIFLLAALVPLTEGSKTNVAFFVLGIAFIVIGTAIARKGRDEATPK